jgi:hypothetical protein
MRGENSPKKNSERSGRLVTAAMTMFMEKRMKLRSNQEKNAVDRPYTSYGTVSKAAWQEGAVAPSCPIFQLPPRRLSDGPELAAGQSAVVPVMTNGSVMFNAAQ